MLRNIAGYIGMISAFGLFMSVGFLREIDGLKHGLAALVVITQSFAIIHYFEMSPKRWYYCSFLFNPIFTMLANILMPLYIFSII